jgi:acyl carrier protein
MSENTQAGLDVEELRALVADALELPVSDVTDDADFVEDLEVDSLISLEIAIRLEERYGIKVTDTQMSETSSFGQVRDLVASLLAEGAAA